MHLDAIDLKDFYACPLGRRRAPAAWRAHQGAVQRRQGHERVRARLRRALSCGIQDRGAAVWRADAGRARRHCLARAGSRFQRAGRRDGAPARRRSRRPAHPRAYAGMVGEIARAAARDVARAEAERAASDRRPQSPRALGARRYHAVRLWQPVQPPPAHQAPEGGRCSRRRNGNTRSICRPSTGASC